VKSALALALSILAAGVVSSRASGIYLSPTLVALDHDSPVASLTVRNDTDRVVAFQVRSFAWSNAPDTSIRLEPTDDVVVYPASIQLDPGDTRRVRIGSRIQAGPSERGYRLILDELPVAVADGQAPISLVTRMQFSLPVFLQAKDRSARVDMPPPQLLSTGVRLSLANTGATHVTPERIEARGLDGAGATVWTRTFRPWYLLAGESRQLDAVLSSAECASTRRVVAEAAFAEGRRLTLHEEQRVADAACGDR
jgi:fimbrial chaperone protein